MNSQVKAFLNMLAWSELGQELLDQSDDGYNVIVGSRPGKMLLFDDYSDHPRRLITVRPGLKSTAAGRYQILARIFDAYKPILNLRDFGKISQDKIAIKLINECGASKDIVDGRIREAIAKCASRWASLPGAGYGQREHKMDSLAKRFVACGGVV